MISVRDAQERILARAIPPLAPELVLLAEAPGRVLAAGVRAPFDVPPRDNSAVDGYAIASADIPLTGTRFLRVVGDLPAGAVLDSPLRPGEAVKIMTGAPIPGGADTVVPIEAVWWVHSLPVGHELDETRVYPDGDHGHVDFGAIPIGPPWAEAELSPVPAIAVAACLGRPVLLNYHSGEAPDHLRRSGIARALLGRVAANVVPSRFLVDVFHRFGLPAEAIANVVDRERFAYRERDRIAPRILSTRNLEPNYNVACTLRAFARVQARRPDATLTVVEDSGHTGSAAFAAALRTAIDGFTP